MMNFFKYFTKILCETNAPSETWEEDKLHHLSGVISLVTHFK